ncbi:NADH-quinone oxidoreductase, E subunit [SAR116 cluster alpha proteobacterium HIMB100]|nr:NADH-quinone oxidoreductase, E subunit [SAR116 cluster alpha proteobacterium HIMB100]
MSISTLIAENQPDVFAFTAESEAEIQQQLAKYPDGRQASAVKSLLYIAQRQHDNWIPMKAIEAIAERLAMPEMRVLEVASFYTMFNLKPVGKWYLQVCGTTPCMLRGSDDVSRCIKDKLNITSGQTSECGKFSLLEVECLGACVNAPILQVNDDFYEDMDYQSTADLLTALAADKPPAVGSVIGRQGSESEDGATTLKAVKKSARGGK